MVLFADPVGVARQLADLVLLHARNKLRADKMCNKSPPPQREINAALYLVGDDPSLWETWALEGQGQSATLAAIYLETHDKRVCDGGSSSRKSGSSSTDSDFLSRVSF